MSISVKAKAPGYYGKLREIGEPFTIKEEKDFSSRWMERDGKPKAQTEGDPDTTQPPASLEDKTRDQLMAQGSNLGLTGLSQLKKGELIQAIRAKQEELREGDPDTTQPPALSGE